MDTVIPGAGSPGGGSGGGYGGGGAGQTPMKTPPVDRSFSLLCEAFGNLDDTVKQLKRRLIPILGPEVPTPGDPLSAKNPRTEPNRLSEKMDLLTMGVKQTRSIVNELLERLEI